MKALVDQSLKPANIMKIPQMVKTYYDNVDTNIPLDLIMKFAAKAKSFDTTAMHTATLPGEPKNINGISYYIPYTDESSRLVKEMFLNQEAVESIKNNNDEAN